MVASVCAWTAPLWPGQSGCSSQGNGGDQIELHVGQLSKRQYEMNLLTKLVILHDNDGSINWKRLILLYLSFYGQCICMQLVMCLTIDVRSMLTISGLIHGMMMMFFERLSMAPSNVKRRVPRLLCGGISNGALCPRGIAWNDQWLDLRGELVMSAMAIVFGRLENPDSLLPAPTEQVVFMNYTQVFRLSEFFCMRNRRVLGFPIHSG